MLWFCKNTHQIHKLTSVSSSELNEINILRGISKLVLPLAALPLTNQYTCRECPDTRPVQTQTHQQSRHSLGLGQDWLSFRPKFAFLSLFVHYSHNKWFFSGIRFKLTIDRNIKHLLPSRHSGIPPYSSRIEINDSHW